MLLSDHDIRNELECGNVGLSPCDLSLLQPSSIDVCLGNEFLMYSDTADLIDPRHDQSSHMERFEVSTGSTFLLPAHGFALGSTAERIRLPLNIASRFEGKSSIGRLGLLPHTAAGFIDPGFDGYITLELHNVTGLPMLLLPGMRIGQLCFFYLSSPADVPYGSPSVGSRYQGQRGPTTSRYHLNYK